MGGPETIIYFTPGPSSTPWPTRGALPTYTPLATINPLTPPPVPPGGALGTPVGDVNSIPPAAPPTGGIASTPGAPLVIHYVSVGKGTPDAVDPNLITVKITVDFSGGVEPFQFYDEGMLMPRNPYRVPARCAHPIVHTVRVVSADGQVAEHTYYADVLCD